MQPRHTASMCRRYRPPLLLYQIVTTDSATGASLDTPVARHGTHTSVRQFKSQLNKELWTVELQEIRQHAVQANMQRSRQHEHALQRLAHLQDKAGALERLQQRLSDTSLHLTARLGAAPASDDSLELAEDPVGIDSGTAEGLLVDEESVNECALFLRCLQDVCHVHVQCACLKWMAFRDGCLTAFGIASDQQ